MVARRRKVEETITVSIAPMMGEVKTVRLKEGATVAEALEAGGFDVDVEVRVGGEGAVENDTILEDGDELTIIAGGKIQAGR